jgi:protein-disulfide isomerase
MVAPQLKELLASNSKVNLRFKHYPISNICNPNVGGEGHVNACLAATATDCALKQGKFWEMNSIVFKNQNYLSRKDIEFMAEAQVKLEMTQFKACLDDSNVLKGIQSDIQAADTVGVTGTPSIYIKGVANTEKWYKVTGSVTQLQAALAGLE